jgi:peptidoglycan hydrolase CwlO-like protein
MAKVLVIIGTLLAIAGAIFSYINWQSNQELLGDIQEAEAQAIEAEEETQTVAAERDTAQQQLTEAQARLAELEESVQTAETQLKAAEDKLAEATKASEDKATTLAALQTEFDDYKAKYSPEQIDALGQQVKDLNAELSDVKQARTQAEERVAELENAVVAAEETLQAAPAGQDQMAAANQGAATPSGTGQQLSTSPGMRSAAPAAQGISGRVQAVNAGWNFVVLNVGEADGITPNTRMDVYRNGFKVGSLEVSTVEPQVSTANVVETRDRSIQPGDQVVTVSPSA